MHINGLPEDAAAKFGFLSDLGYEAILLNGVLAMLAGVLLWAVATLVIRMIRGA